MLFRLYINKKLLFVEKTRGTRLCVKLRKPRVWTFSHIPRALQGKKGEGRGGEGKGEKKRIERKQGGKERRKKDLAKANHNKGRQDLSLSLA